MPPDPATARPAPRRLFRAGLPAAVPGTDPQMQRISR